MEGDGEGVGGCMIGGIERILGRYVGTWVLNCIECITACIPVLFVALLVSRDESIQAVIISFCPRSRRTHD